MADDSVSATTVIDAPAEAIFAVLADPAKHAAIDGTGWVCEPVDSEPLTAAGQVFRMSMYHPNHPDGEVPDGQPGPGVRPAEHHLLGDGLRPRRRHAALRRLDLALRPHAIRTLEHHGHALLRLVSGARTPSESSSDSRRSLRSIWATRSPTSPSWSPHPSECRSEPNGDEEGARQEEGPGEGGEEEGARDQRACRRSSTSGSVSWGLARGDPGAHAEADPRGRPRHHRGVQVGQALDAVGRPGLGARRDHLHG